MKQYKGISDPGKGGGCLNVLGGSPSVYTMRKLRGVGWRAWCGLILGGSAQSGCAAAWCCGGREEQLVPRQHARVLLAVQLEAEWLCLSVGKLAPPHPCNHSVHSKVGPRGGGDVGLQPCHCFGCPVAKKWLNVGVSLLCTKKAIDK